ncbi:MAG: iron-sulfur cluster repair di-iron protein [Chitinophagaceae bacterium]
METLNQQKTIGSMVAENYKAASIFRKYGIDFCCQGGRSLEEACREKAINHEVVAQELKSAASDGTSDSIDYRSWPLDLLADYIEKTHHRYVTDKSPEIRAYLLKINKVHGGRHPELAEIEQLFLDSSEELLQHMQKEETVIFPYIRQMVEAERKDQPLPTASFGSIEGPINMMMEEHLHEGKRLARIAELSNGYTTPADGCNTYKVAFAMVEEFEKDLHKHIHLENNILFPKSIELEDMAKS